MTDELTARRYHHVDLRRTIIETASDMLHEEKGWQFTLREIARRAGVSHATPYKHFADKSALLSGLATMGFVQLSETLNMAKPAAAGSVRDQVLPIARHTSPSH